MTKISFNAQALGIANYRKCSDVSHADGFGSFIPIVTGNPEIQPLIERLGFTNVKCLPHAGRQTSTKDVDP